MRLVKSFILLALLSVVGCQSKPSTTEMLTSSAGVERMRAVLRLAKENRWDNVPTFIGFLSDEDVSVRLAAIGALTDQVRTDMDFRASDPPEVRAVSVERWRQWWTSEGYRGSHARPKPTSSSYRQSRGSDV